MPAGLSHGDHNIAMIERGAPMSGNIGAGQMFCR